MIAVPHASRTPGLYITDNLIKQTKQFSSQTVPITQRIALRSSCCRADISSFYYNRRCRAILSLFLESSSHSLIAQLFPFVKMQSLEPLSISGWSDRRRIDTLCLFYQGRARYSLIHALPTRLHLAHALDDFGFGGGDQSVFLRRKSKRCSRTEIRPTHPPCDAMPRYAPSVAAARVRRRRIKPNMHENGS